MKAQITLHNEFDIVLQDTITGEKQIAKAYNVILDRGLTRARNRNIIGRIIHLGTGQGTPAASDTKLFTFATAKQADIVKSSWDEATSSYSVRFKCTFDETEQNGKSFTEIGIGYETSANTLCTHAMIVDEHGSPMVVEKTNTVVLTVYATLYLKVTMPDDTHFVDPEVLCTRLLGHITRQSAYFDTQLGVIEQSPYGGDVYGSSRYVPLALIQKNFTYKTHATGFKGSAEILGSEVNGQLIRDIGLFDYFYSSNYSATGRPQLLHRFEALTGQQTVLKDEPVGTGNGIKKYFPMTYKYPVLSNDKFKVKVDGVEKTATPVVYKSLDPKECSWYNTRGVSTYPAAGKFYHAAKPSTKIKEVLRVYASNGIEYTEADFIGEMPTITWGDSITNHYWGVVPTWVPNKYILYVYGGFGTSTKGVYLCTLDADRKTFTMDTKIDTSAANVTEFTYSEDLKFFCLERDVFYISNTAQATKMGTADRIIGDIAIDTRNFTVYKLAEKLGVGEMSSIGKYIRKTVSEVGIFKRLPQDNMYAIIGVGVEATHNFASVGQVAIIDSATSSITTEEYTVTNPSLNMAAYNATTNLNPVTFKYSSPSYDYALDMVNKTICPHQVCSVTIGAVTRLDRIEQTSPGKYFATGASHWMSFKDSEEYISGFTLEEAPAADAKVTFDGQLNGFLKTPDHKITYEVDVVINA